MMRESQDKLEEMNKALKEKGFQNVETICARGEPAAISYDMTLPALTRTLCATTPSRRRSTRS